MGGWVGFGRHALEGLTGGVMLLRCGRIEERRAGEHQARRGTLTQVDLARLQ